MTLSPGTRLGPYEVTAQIGVGGMGEVYRARDPMLERDVALRVLPEVFALDADRRARFTREARILALLNHPNIVAIYGFEFFKREARVLASRNDSKMAALDNSQDASEVSAIVMELVEGPTLADRIVQGTIPVDEALAIAKQIAEALEAAHEQGIIHRDLKPVNIKLMPNDTVKVLDCGMAQIFEPDLIADDSSRAPASVSQAARLMCAITGTPEYMSPEQVHGEPLDHRSDIWAFGCVLFEMLTGRRAFDGEDLSAILTTVLEGDPEWTALPATTPTSILQLLQRCLDKNPERREQDIGEACNVIADAIAKPTAMEACVRQSALEGLSDASNPRNEADRAGSRR